MGYCIRDGVPYETVLRVRPSVRLCVRLYATTDASEWGDGDGVGVIVSGAPQTSEDARFRGRFAIAVSGTTPSVRDPARAWQKMKRCSKNSLFTDPRYVY